MVDFNLSYITGFGLSEPSRALPFYALWEDAASTTLAAAANPGDAVLQVACRDGFAVGDTIRVGEGASAERSTVAGVGGSILQLAKPLTGGHLKGTAVIVLLQAAREQLNAPAPIWIPGLGESRYELVPWLGCRCSWPCTQLCWRWLFMNTQTLATIWMTVTVLFLWVLLEGLVMDLYILKARPRPSRPRPSRPRPTRGHRSDLAQSPDLARPPRDAGAGQDVARAPLLLERLRRGHAALLAQDGHDARVHWRHVRDTPSLAARPHHLSTTRRPLIRRPSRPQPLCTRAAAALTPHTRRHAETTRPQVHRLPVLRARLPLWGHQQGHQGRRGHEAAKLPHLVLQHALPAAHPPPLARREARDQHRLVLHAGLLVRLLHRPRPRARSHDRTHARADRRAHTHTQTPPPPATPSTLDDRQRPPALSFRLLLPTSLPRPPHRCRHPPRSPPPPHTHDRTILVEIWTVILPAYLPFLCPLVLQFYFEGSLQNISKLYVVFVIVFRFIGARWRRAARLRSTRD